MIGEQITYGKLFQIISRSVIRSKCLVDIANTERIATVAPEAMVYRDTRPTVQNSDTCLTQGTLGNSDLHKFMISNHLK